MGPRTRAFEDQIAGYLGVRHAFRVANGTCALELAYAVVLERYHECEPDGDKRPAVLVPDLTFVATANAAVWAGANPTFTDCQSPVNPLTPKVLLAERLENAGPAVAAVSVVHYAGFEAPVPSGADTWSRDLGIIEDAAHAIGSTSGDGRKLGTLGHIGCFSFFSNKNMATGEGGLITTDDCDYATRLRLLRSHGLACFIEGFPGGTKHGKYSIQRRIISN
jgi:dTDP-4-amino-4,6-dideoxygalactose transaminase